MLNHAWQKWDRVNGGWVADDETATDKFMEDTIIVDGVVRWNSNRSVPPTDCMEQWNRIGLPFDFEKSEATRKAELSAS